MGLNWWAIPACVVFLVLAIVTEPSGKCTSLSKWLMKTNRRLEWNVLDVFLTIALHHVTKSVLPRRVYPKSSKTRVGIGTANLMYGEVGVAIRTSLAASNVFRRWLAKPEIGTHSLFPCRRELIAARFSARDMGNHLQNWNTRVKDGDPEPI